MAIRLKSSDEIERMRKAGRIVRHVLTRLGEIINAGMTTEDLNTEAERLCVEAGAQCLFKGVPGRAGVRPFPGAICASVNDEVVHGIPGDREIQDGDLVSVDFGVRLDGWCGDAAETFIVGQADDEKRRLVEVTKNALSLAVAMSGPGQWWSNVASSMQEYVESEGFSVIRDFVGHGIGQEMHEAPKVPNFVSPQLRVNDIRLEPGLVLAVEPMVNMGGPQVRYGADGWVVLTLDGKPSAHFEHTIAITTDGVSVLTDGK